MRSAAKVVALIACISLMFTSANAQRRKAKVDTEKNAAKTASARPEQAGSPVVARVISGDLLELTSGERVRLMGADAPVMPEPKKPGQEPWASQARRFTEGLLLGKEIVIKNFGLNADEYGRRIGLVYAGETWVDYELIKHGFAVVQPNPYLDNKSKQLLVEAQHEARNGYCGIWNPNNPLPQPPREFRAANGLAEGDNSKADSWKRAASPANPPPLATKSGSSAARSSSNGTTTGNETATGDLAGLQAARQMLEVLMQVQARVNEGVKSGEFSRLVNGAGQRFEEMINGTPVDRTLARDLKDALDGYRLALDAVKRKEAATAEEAAKFTKYIDGALEVSDKAIASASQRLQLLSKAHR